MCSNNKTYAHSMSKQKNVCRIYFYEHKTCVEKFNYTKTRAKLLCRIYSCAHFPFFLSFFFKSHARFKNNKTLHTLLLIKKNSHTFSSITNPRTFFLLTQLNTNNNLRIIYFSTQLKPAHFLLFVKITTRAPFCISTTRARFRLSQTFTHYCQTCTCFLF